MITPVLSGDLGVAVQDTWKPFAAHGNECIGCEMAILELKMAPDDPNRAYDALCETGQALFTTWFDAKAALIARLRALTAPWGMAGLVGEEADQRSDAIVAMPGPAAADLFRDPDAERRESIIRALIAGTRLDKLRTSPATGEETRPCAAEDCQTGPYGSHGSFVVDPARSRRRYCCEACRKRDQRPRLMSTEE